MSVYEHDTAFAPTEYLGCWEDSRGDRIMDVVESDAFMTNNVSVYPILESDTQAVRARHQQV